MPRNSKQNWAWFIDHEIEVSLSLSLSLSLDCGGADCGNDSERKAFDPWPLGHRAR